MKVAQHSTTICDLNHIFKVKNPLKEYFLILLYAIKLLFKQFVEEIVYKEIKQA